MDRSKSFRSLSGKVRAADASDRVAAWSERALRRVDAGEEEAYAASYPAVPHLARRPLTIDEQMTAARNIPLQRQPLWRPRPMTYVEEKLYPVLRIVGAYSKHAQYGVNADAVWRSIEEQATQDAWFEALGIRRTFMTEQSLINLHVWLLHKRHMVRVCLWKRTALQLPQEEDEQPNPPNDTALHVHEWPQLSAHLDFFEPGMFCGRLADKQLFERYWEDTTWRIRNAGVQEMSVNKQLEIVQKTCFMDMFELDFAIKQDDDNMELSGALFKSVFQGDDNASVENVVRLADWVRDELTNLVTQPKEDVYRGWITWSPVLGESEEDRLERQRRMFEGEWRERIYLDGSIFFYHTHTGEVTREVPETGLYTRRRFALAHHLQRLADEGKIDAALVNPNKLESFAALPEADAEDGEEEGDGGKPSDLSAPRGRVVLPDRPSSAQDVLR